MDWRLGVILTFAYKKCLVLVNLILKSNSGACKLYDQEQL